MVLGYHFLWTLQKSNVSYRSGMNVPTLSSRIHSQFAMTIVHGTITVTANLWIDRFRCEKTMALSIKSLNLNLPLERTRIDGGPLAAPQ